MLWIIVLVWIVCGYFAYGYNLAYFQKEYPLMAEENYKDRVLTSLAGAIVWPFTFLFLAANGGFKHGRMYRRE